MLRFRPAHAALPLLITALLAGCGGGGGGGNSGGGTTPTASPALTFTSATATGSIGAGASLTLNVIAAVARPSDFSGSTPFASIVDSNGVLLSSSTVVRDSDSQYHAVLQTAPTLAAGSYKGNFSVRLCRDSGCASQYPGSPVALPYDITVTPAGSAAFSATPAMPLTASTQAGGAAPASVAVAISAGGRSWTASTGGAAWLKLSATSGSGDSTLTVAYDTASLAQGSYSATITITAADGQKAELPVALTVLAPGLVLGSNSVTFNAINGAPIASQIVSLDTDNKLSTAWTASSNVGWLSVSPTAGSTPATTILTVDSTVGTLASGSYSGNITVTPSGLPVRTLPVTLKLTPATLLASASTVTLGGTYGRDFSSTQPLKFTLDTSTNSWPWELTGLPAWVSTTSTSGTVNAAGASLTVTPLAAGASTGANTKLATATARVNGDVVQTAVLFSLNKDVHKLLPAETAVAFVSTPGWSRMTRTITVSDNYGSFGGMSATSDAAWLVAGVSGNQLTLTADSSQLLDDTVSTATITLTATDGDASAPETIRVGLWKGSASPTAAASIKAALPYTTVATDPARPYAYLHNGGAYIDVYNVYTGAKVTSITGFSAHLGDMAVSPNGDALYVVDIDNARITTVSLRTQAISAQLPLAAAGTAATRIKLIRPNGIELLVLSDGQVYRTSTAVKIGTLPLTTGGTLAASADGKRLLQQDEGNSGIQHTSVSVDYAAINGGTLFGARLAAASHASPGTLGQDLWVNSDGSRVIYAAATPKSCTLMDATSLGILGYMAVGDAAPNNIEVAVDGRILCGGATKSSSSDIYLFDSTGKALNQYKVGATGRQLLPRQMAVSGDGWIVVAVTDDGVVSFLAVGP